MPQKIIDVKKIRFADSADALQLESGVLSQFFFPAKSTRKYETFASDLVTNIFVDEKKVANTDEEITNLQELSGDQATQNLKNLTNFTDDQLRLAKNNYSQILFTCIPKLVQDSLGIPGLIVSPKRKTGNFIKTEAEMFFEVHIKGLKGIIPGMYSQQSLDLNLNATIKYKLTREGAFIESVILESDDQELLDDLEALLTANENKQRVQAKYRQQMIAQAMESLNEATSLSDARNHLTHVLSIMPEHDEKVIAAKEVASQLDQIKTRTQESTYVAIAKQTARIANNDNTELDDYLENAKKVQNRKLLLTGLLLLGGLALIGASVALGVLTHGGSTPLSIYGVKVGLDMVIGAGIVGLAMVSGAFGLFHHKKHAPETHLKNKMEKLTTLAGNRQAN